MGTRERNCSGTCFAGVGWGWGWWWNQVLCLLSLTTSQPVLSCQRLQMSLVLAVVLSGQRPQMSQTFRAWLLFWFLVTSSRFTQQPTDRAWLPRSHAWSGAHWLWGHAWNPTPDTGLKRRMDASWVGPLDLTAHLLTPQPSRALWIPRQRLSAAALSWDPHRLCGASECFFSLYSVL